MAQPGSTYIVPRKVILTKENLESFQQSKTHEAIVSYITALNECVVGVKLTDDVSVSPVRKFVYAAFARHAGLNNSLGLFAGGDWDGNRVSEPCWIYLTMSRRLQTAYRPWTTRPPGSETQRFGHSTTRSPRHVLPLRSAKRL